MALEFNPPAELLRPRDYSYIPKTIDTIMDSYMRARQLRQQDEALRTQKGLTMAQLGFDPAQVTPEIAQRASLAADRGGIQIGQAPSDAQGHGLGALEQALTSYMQKRREKPQKSVGLEDLLAQRVQSGEMTIEEAFKLKASSSPTLMRPPTGFERTGTGELRPIPGGPAAIKQEEAQTARTNAARNAREKAQSVVQEIDNLVPRIGGMTSGFFGNLSSGIGGTPAADVRADLTKIQANVAFNALQAMREASKTGGALGQVSERELALLQAEIAALGQEQSPDQLKRNLEKVKEHFVRMAQLAESDAGVSQSAPAAEAEKPIALTGDKAKRLQELRQKLRGR